MLAAMMTKAIGTIQFGALRNKLGIQVESSGSVVEEATLSKQVSSAMSCMSTGYLHVFV
jgi:hypothetical protein